MYSEPFCLELAIYHSYARSQCEWIGMFEAEPGGNLWGNCCYQEEGWYWSELKPVISENIGNMEKFIKGDLWDLLGCLLLFILFLKLMTIMESGWLANINLNGHYNIQLLANYNGSGMRKRKQPTWMSIATYSILSVIHIETFSYTAKPTLYPTMVVIESSLRAGRG